MAGAATRGTPHRRGESHGRSGTGRSLTERTGSARGVASAAMELWRPGGGRRDGGECQDSGGSVDVGLIAGFMGGAGKRQEIRFVSHVPQLV